MRVISVKYSALSGAFSYLTYDETLQPGDKVVVPVKDTLKVAEVFEVDLPEHDVNKAGYDLRSVIQKVDMDGHFAKMKDLGVEVI